MLVFITIFTFTNQPSTDGASFSTENAQPNGSMALAEVLRQQGVDVVAVDQFDELKRLATNNPNSQVLLIDPNNKLKADYFTQLHGMTNRLILLQPGFDQLGYLGLSGSVMTGGTQSDKPLRAASCTGDSSHWLNQAAERAGDLTPDATGYRSSTTAVVSCYNNEDNPDLSSLLVIERANHEIVILGHHGLLANETVALEGNASLALSLFGKEKTLYWYMPSYLDSVSGKPTLGDLTPPWVTPVIIVTLMTIITYAFYSGRRMGPLVAEKLPVTVPANETVEGRARMYQHGQSFDHVLKQLRMGTLGRLAKTLGVGRNSNYQMVVMQAAAITGQSIESLDQLLISGPVTSENDLMKMSDELLKLEQAVTAAVKS